MNNPKAIICDIDGTLAIMGKRSPYDWKSVGIDTVKEDIANIVRTYHSLKNLVVIFSGREDSCREITEEWLEKNNIPYNLLLMRKAGDHRKDSIVKEEMYRTWIENDYDVMFVLDDRNQVVKMWREIGLTCLQVAEGDF